MFKIILTSYYGLKESIFLAIQALTEIDIEIIDYPLFQYSRDVNDRKSNYLEEFIKFVSFHEPFDGFLFWCLTFTTAELKILKETFPHVLFTFFNWDDPQSWNEKDMDIANKAKFFDIVYTSCKECCKWYTDCGTRIAVWCPPGFDPSVHFPKPNSAYTCDVSLCATQLYSEEEQPNQYISRKKLVDAIVADGTIDFRLYGPEKFKNQYPKNYHGFIYYENTSLVYFNSKINICHHVVSNKRGYINERVMLVAGSGGLIFIDPVVGLEDIFVPNKECIMMKDKNPQKIIEQIKEILSQREKYNEIANNARERALKNYTWKHWAERIQKELVRIKFDKNFYLSFNKISPEDLIPFQGDVFKHWENIGKFENYLPFTLNVPENFNYKLYSIINGLESFENSEKAYAHYILKGQKEGLIYPKRSPPKDKSPVPFTSSFSLSSPSSFNRTSPAYCKINTETNVLIDENIELLFFPQVKSLNVPENESVRLDIKDSAKLFKLVCDIYFNSKYNKKAKKKKRKHQHHRHNSLSSSSSSYSSSSSSSSSSSFSSSLSSKRLIKLDIFFKLLQNLSDKYPYYNASIDIMRFVSMCANRGF